MKALETESVMARFIDDDPRAEEIDKHRKAKALDEKLRSYDNRHQ